MPTPPQSLLAWAAMAEAERAARMATPWALSMQSDDPQSVATALCWLGLHLREMFWRFEITSEVDRLGAALHGAAMESE